MQLALLARLVDVSQNTVWDCAKHVADIFDLDVSTVLNNN